MSRIYEALQKAESERTTERRPGEPLTEDAPVRVERQPYPAASPDRHNYAAAPLVADLYSDPAAQEIEGLNKGLDNALNNELNIDRIVRRPWTPSLPQLPALLERGAAVEQFRSLRSRIYELRDIKPLKTILVTSGLAQEGKSFVSTNLALSLARHKNSKVLLIDGDMRRYTLHQLLGCESHPGLADYLAGKVELEEVMQRAEQSVDTDGTGKPLLPNLTFIAGGNGGDKAADLSGSPRFGELLNLAAPYFDWIIVDSSPVLPVSDAVNLARSCDGVLLVARGGVTKFPIAQRAQSELKASNILGFVLNAVHDAPQVGGYYGYDASKN